MKDIILRDQLASFSREYSLSNLSESTRFEHFSSYCVLSRVVDYSVDTLDVWCGGESSFGIDGAAVVVNENIVFEPEEVDSLVERFHALDAHFIFIQSKTSDKFESGEILKLCSAAEAFFDPDNQPDAYSEQLQRLHSLQKHIFSLTSRMRRSPALSLYYVTTGQWRENSTLKTLINRQKRSFAASGNFSTVDIFPVDRMRLIDFYRQIKLRFVKEIVFDRHVTLPAIDGVKEAFIGILPAPDFVSLITGDDGFLQRSIFYDNIRDFQGFNKVNAEIQDTLRNDNRVDRFPLLNNGVTIVAKSIRRVGNKFRIEDFQVVNGCQTSHVLFLNKENLRASSFVAIKLIATDRSDLANDVIRATNWQTVVTNEAFASLEPFHKMLEQYYNAVSEPHRLYYERRSKQYDSEDVEKTRVISFPTQLKCIVAVFLSEPHSTHRYYGELLQSYRSRIFVETHACAPYYLSALLLYVLENLIRERHIPQSHRAYRFHLMLLARVLARGEVVPPLLAGRDIETYCGPLQAELQDVEVAKSLFASSSEIIESVLSTWPGPPSEASRSKEFTQQLIKRARFAVGAAPPRLSTRGALSAAVEAVSSEKAVGRVRWYNHGKGYGIIEDVASGESVFLHVLSLLTRCGRADCPVKATNLPTR